MRNNERGITLVEVMVGTVILTYVSLAMMQGVSMARKQNISVNDKAAACQKVAQIMTEIKAKQSRTLTFLNGLADANYNNCLSINPINDLLSINPDMRYVRKVTVQDLPNTPGAKIITVAVYRNSDKAMLAEAVNVLSADQ